MLDTLLVFNDKRENRSLNAPVFFDLCLLLYLWQVFHGFGYGFGWVFEIFQAAAQVFFIRDHVEMAVP